MKVRTPSGRARRLLRRGLGIAVALAAAVALAQAPWWQGSAPDRPVQAGLRG